MSATARLTEPPDIGSDADQPSLPDAMPTYKYACLPNAAVCHAVDDGNHGEARELGGSACGTLEQNA